VRATELIARFYTCFQAKDAAGMRACYHPEIVFSDPVFGELRGADAGEMWAMLCSRARDLEITYSGVQADGSDDGHGAAHWEALYTFTHTGRRVHNVIDAAFSFRDGLIVRHDDRFDLYRWSRQAFGPLGVVLGWAPFFQSKIRANARRGFDAWLAKKR
jgi:ketosteroid isomerase-like protein